MTQSLPVAIRPITEADRPVWQALWHDYLLFYKTALPQAVYDSTFARLIAGNAGIHGLLAERGGVALGLTHFIFHPSCWKIEPACYLQDLFTTPAARGSGVGRALIEAVYARADAAGAPGGLLADRREQLSGADAL